MDVAKGPKEERPPAAMAGAPATIAAGPLVLHSADDHHAFHEDAKPGDLSSQLPSLEEVVVEPILDVLRRLARENHTL